MNPSPLMTRACTVVTVTQSEDAWGTPIDVETTTATVCELQQQQRNSVGPDEWQSSIWRLFLPAGTNVNGIDRVRVDGVTFSVDGPPWAVRNPRTGARSHIEATLEVVS